MTKRFFVTGTDTDAGKTFVSSVLLHKARQDGKSCFGLKPVAAGCDLYPDQNNPAHQSMYNSDALELQAASFPYEEYAVHNPIALEPPVAPHIAAEEAGIPLTVESLMTACRPGLNRTVDFHLTEGAGGWLVPLNETETLADFASRLEADVILVVGMKLGCINHTMLTVAAIQSSGLSLAGWIANHIDPDMSRQDENFNYLKEHISAPCLGRIPYSADVPREELTGFITLP